MAKRLLAVCATLALVAFAAGCGDDDDDGDGAGSAATTTEQAATTTAPQEQAASGTAIKTADSQYGQVLFDGEDQAVYYFDKESSSKSECYGACAEAWPPVLTEGEPKAGDGVNADLLGTVERRDGKTQVTYADQPLYFYAHEGPGEVKCHNVDLNGGLWWVVGPDGERRP